MKKLLFILAAMLFSFNTYSQNKENIINHYSDIFKTQRNVFDNDRAWVHITINEIDAASPYGNLINNYGNYVEYLRMHFTNDTIQKYISDIEDSIELHNTYVKLLEADSEFNKIMLKLTDKIDNKDTYIPDTVSMTRVLNIAAKYFYIMGIDDNGNYEVKICTGINGIKETEKNRRPFVEAFCFEAIIRNVNSEEYNTWNMLVEGVKAVYKLNLGVEEDEKLLRAQGAMYMYVRNMESLKAMLIDEYKENKEYLPFVIRGID